MATRAWIVALVVIAVLGAFGYVLTRTNSPATEESQAEAAGQAVTPEGVKPADERYARAPGATESVILSDADVSRNGIVIEVVGPGRLRREFEFPAEIALNSDHEAHIVPRFSGITQKVFKNLGDRVEAGEILAIVQSNESVAPYDVKTLLAGTVIEKHVTLGEFVRDDADIFVVADLSTVWVQISVYAKYLPQIRPGLEVGLFTTGVPDTARGKIDYVGPIVGDRSRTSQARVVLPNSKGYWQPGLFVTARVALEDIAVQTAILDDAIQTVKDRPVVFVRNGNRFEVRPVILGRSDGSWVEVLSGLAPGERYAKSNSFILKAELGKSEAGDED